MMWMGGRGMGDVHLLTSALRETGEREADENLVDEILWPRRHGNS